MLVGSFDELHEKDRVKNNVFSLLEQNLSILPLFHYTIQRDWELYSVNELTSSSVTFSSQEMTPGF